MTIQQLIDFLEKAPDKQKPAMILCYSANMLSQAYMFVELESASFNMASSVVLNVPGAKLPDSVAGAIA